MSWVIADTRCVKIRGVEECIVIAAVVVGGRPIAQIEIVRAVDSLQAECVLVRPPHRALPEQPNSDADHRTPGCPQT